MKDFVVGIDEHIQGILGLGTEYLAVCGKGDIGFAYIGTEYGALSATAHIDKDEESHLPSKASI
mgnify:FL=1